MSTEQPTKATRDQRDRHRPKVIRTGLIVFSSEHCSMGCTVMDLSQHGARLWPDDPLRCPDEFSLFIKDPAHGSAHHRLQSYIEEHVCHVVWRDGLYVGVVFLQQAEGSPR